MPETSAIVRLVGGYQVVVGSLGVILVMASGASVLRAIEYGSQTGQLGAALVNVAIALAFLRFFSLALIGGVNAWRLRGGRTARLLPVLLIVQAPVLAVPGFQFFMVLVPPQVGVMFLPTGNVRLGLLFELGARFNLERPANLSEKPGSIRPRQTGSRSEERSTWNGQPFVKTMARAFSSSRLFDGTDFNLTA